MIEEFGEGAGVVKGIGIVILGVDGIEGAGTVMVGVDRIGIVDMIGGIGGIGGERGIGVVRIETVDSVGIELVTVTEGMEGVTVLVLGTFDLNEYKCGGSEGVVVDTVRFIPSTSIVDTFDSVCFSFLVLMRIFITIDSSDEFVFISPVESGIIGFSSGIPPNFKKRELNTPGYENNNDFIKYASCSMCP